MLLIIHLTPPLIQMPGEVISCYFSAVAQKGEAFRRKAVGLACFSPVFSGRVSRSPGMA
jgi:hypothetical protein